MNSILYWENNMKIMNRTKKAFRWGYSKWAVRWE